MSLDIQKLSDIVDKDDIITDADKLNDLYCKPILDGDSITPKAAVLPKNTLKVMMNYSITLS